MYFYSDSMEERMISIETDVRAKLQQKDASDILCKHKTLGEFLEFIEEEMNVYFDLDHEYDMDENERRVLDDEYFKMDELAAYLDSTINTLQEQFKHKDYFGFILYDVLEALIFAIRHDYL